MAIHPTERWHMVERELDGVSLVESPDWLWASGRTGWDLWDTARRTSWIRQRRFDVIHTVDTRPAVALPALLGRRRSGAIWISDWTDWWGRGGATQERDGRVTRRLVGPLEQLFEEKPRPYADGTVVISRALGERALGLGIPAEKILYLPPGTDRESIRETSKASARLRCDLQQDGCYVGYLGNIYPRDAGLLFDTLGRLKNPRAKVIMVGEPGCKVSSEVSDRVIVTGRLPLDAMLDHLSSCDVLVLPLSDSVANRGRWPSKVNEYLAVGRPIVACNVGDIAQFLDDNRIGVLTRPDPVEFAARLDELLADPARAQEMGDRARQVALTSYSEDSVANRLEQFYLNVLTARSTSDVRVTC